MRVKTVLARGTANLVRRVPRALGPPLVWVVACLLMVMHGRRTALENLSRVFPEKSGLERWRIAFAAYRQAARSSIEFLHAHKYSDGEIRRRMRIENPEVLEAAHREGRGVILVSGHFGNWEWLGRRVSIAGYPFAALYKEPKDPGLAKRLRDQRAAAGVTVIDHDDARTALQWLRGGNVLGIIMDQEPKRPEEGVVVPLFGRPTRTHFGPFRLARMTGAPVLTVFCRRTAPGRYRAEFIPLELSDDPDPERAYREAAAKFNARLEAAIRRDPDHWLWMYRRWKRIARRPASVVES